MNPHHSPVLFTILLLAGCLSAPTAHSQVVLNEILAENGNAVENAGDHPDYIELFNKGAATVDLGGMSLTDDPAVPRRFVFPAGTTIAAGGYLLVWCDTEFTKPGLHSGFRLGATGERIQIYAANGITILDDMTFGLQARDLSLGRLPDGGTQWTLTRPSALAANVGQAMTTPGQLRLNEWMARPAVGDDWIELFNAASQPVLLGGLVLTDTYGSMPLNRAIPRLSFIGAGGYVIFQATDLEKTDADHLDFKLGASGEVLSLYHSNRTTLLDRVSFGSQTTDVSQGRTPDGSENIISFAAGRSTPGAPNYIALTNVVITEVLTHTDAPLEDAIELQNPTTTPVDISHWWLSDSASQPRKFQIPDGTVLSPGGFQVFYQYQFGAGSNAFGLSSAQGEQIYLSAGDSAGKLTGPQVSVAVGPLKNGVSIGQHRTSRGVDWVPLSRRTLGVDAPASLAEFRQGQGLSNAVPRVGPVVISELMFSPSGSGGVAEEFIELHNPTSFQVPLFDPDYPGNRWKFAEGIFYEFPPSLVMPPRSYLLLVSFDPIAEPARLAAFRTRYSVSSEVPVIGPYADHLSDTGEAVQLVWPDLPELDPVTGLTFVPYENLERLNYTNNVPWPAGAAGTGFSLQRRTMLDYGNEPLNWVAAMPTAGRSNLPDVDSDTDGMPDEWELVCGFDPDWDGDAELDADGDGASNEVEYVAGTHPRDGSSVLRFTSVRRSTSEMRLRFTAVAERSYSIQTSPVVSGGQWTAATNLPPATATAETEVVLPCPPGAQCWFRLAASMSR